MTAPRRGCALAADNVSALVIAFLRALPAVAASARVAAAEDRPAP